MGITDYLQQRKYNIMHFMAQNNLDVILLSNPENIFYYTNFNPILYSSPPFVIIKKTGEIILLIHALRNCHAKSTKNILGSIILYGKWGYNSTIAPTYTEALISLLKGNPLNLGIETSHISNQLFHFLNKELIISSVKDITPFISYQRAIKDNYEIECIKRACNLSDLGVTELIKALRAGHSEIGACTEAHYQMRKKWEKDFSNFEISGFGSLNNGEVDSFNVWCLSNERIAYGCDCPINYKPKIGDLVLPMVWARIGGYSAETERTCFIGNLSPEKDKLFDTVLTARNAVFENLKPGVSFSSIYSIAETIFIKNGFKDFLPGRIGHDVGLSGHGTPSISKNNLDCIQENMVLTIEPGILIENYGGVRHSDTVLITKNGFDFLTNINRGKLKIDIV